MSKLFRGLNKKEINKILFRNVIFEDNIFNIMD